MGTRKTAKKATTMNNTSDKVTCQECKAHEAHILLKHLREEHQLTAAEYSDKHPGAAVFSETGGALIKSKIQSVDDNMVRPDRETETVTVGDVWGKSGEEFDDYEVTRFLEHSKWVPAGNDDGYVYDQDVLLGLLYALHRPRRNSVWICGYSGTGKTDLVINVHRRLNRECIRICFDSYVSPEMLVGQMKLVGQRTEFQYGLLPQAMKRGATLFLDELDLANPHVLPVLRPVLEDDPTLVILDNGGELVKAHPDFRVVVSANTFGTGDSTGLYGTTHVLSLADRQRFSLFLQMEYLEPDKEKQVLLDAVPDLEDDEAELMVKVGNRIRESYREGRIEESVSPRQLINWADVYSESGDALVAANMAFLLPLGEASQLAIRQLIEEVGLVKHEA